MPRKLFAVSAGVAIMAALSYPIDVARAGPTYAYDSLGRVVSVRYDNGAETRYSYDAAGNRTQHIISVAAGNQRPIANTDTVTLYENASSVSLDPRLNDSDPDGNAITLTSVAGGDQGAAALSGSGTSVTYSSSVTRSGTDRISYVISDGQGGEASGDIIVTRANLSPVAVNDVVNVDNFSTAAFDPRANDTDPGSDPIVITGNSMPANGTLTQVPDGAGFYYRPADTFHGPDSFTYSIADADGGTATGTVTMAVSPPKPGSDTIVPIKNMAETFDPRVNDVDVQGSVTITGKTNGAKGSVVIGAGGTALTYTPNLDLTGADSFTYTVSDTDGLTATATVNVNILAQNTVPIAVGDAITTQRDANCKYVKVFNPRWNDSDADGHVILVTAKTNGSNGAVTIMFGGTQVKYVRGGNLPTVSTPKTDSFTYTISDGHGGTATATVNVSIPWDDCDTGGTN